MPTTKNTSYKVHVQHTDQSEVDNVNIESGAMLHTNDALYMGHGGSNVIVYPQGGTTQLGWARYDDTTYTSSNKLSLSDGVEVKLPNNGGAIYRSHSSIDFYNSTSQKLLGLNENDVYVTTIVFNVSSPNANQTHIDLRMVGSGDIERVHKTMAFFKGNDTAQNFHEVFQYYTDSTFVSDGVDVKISSIGGSASVWDIIFFIQRTQNASLS
jgi:hypothetical protein